LASPVALLRANHNLFALPRAGARLKKEIGNGSEVPTGQTVFINNFGFDPMKLRRKA
jgi:hypothetical protein